MAGVFDCGVGSRGVEECGYPGEGHVERWRALRDTIHQQVCERGYHPRIRKRSRSLMDSDAMDASRFARCRLSDFCQPDDERIRGTIAAVERELIENGFVLRYRPQEEQVDGLPGRDGAFLPCSFWFAACLDWIGEKERAREWFERLLALRNDLGLLAEEYDPIAKRQLGNFPQAFSHIAIITTAYRLSEKS